MKCCQNFISQYIAYPSISKAFSTHSRPTPNALQIISKEHALGAYLVCKLFAFAAKLQTGCPRGMFLFNEYITRPWVSGTCQTDANNFCPKDASFYEVGIARNRHWFRFTTRFLLIPLLQWSTLELICPSRFSTIKQCSNWTNQHIFSSQNCW